MATADIATLGIRVDARQVVEGDRALQGFQRSGDRAEQSADRLSGTMARLSRMAKALAAALSVQELIKQADAWANLQGRLSLVTDSQRQLVAMQNQLYAIAQRTRSQLEGTVDLYARITRSTQSLNKTDAERLRVTETINKAITISGASSTAAAAALLQLGQAFGSNRLGGEELNSVLEQTPRLAEAIAVGMGRTVGDLKSLAEAGKLTADVVFKALSSQSATLDAEFAKMPKTVGQAFVQIQNAVLRYVGVTDQAGQMSAGLANAMTGVANNVDKLAAALAGIATTKALSWLAGMTRELWGKLAATSANIAAERARAAATLASAEADNLAAAAELRLAEVEAGAALGATARAASSARLTAATVAQAEATVALGAAQAAANGVAGWGARALGLLGGPIGVITTLLGAGVAAWMMWGDKAKESETKAEQSLSEKTVEIIASLDKQIAKLEERNRLMKVAPDVAKAETPAAEQQRAILTELDRIGKDTNLSLEARTEIMRVLGAQYAELTAKAERAAAAQKSVDAATNADKVANWLAKNIEYLKKSEQIAAAIKKAKTELGDAFNPEIEKRIRDSFAKQDVTKEKGAYAELIAAIHSKTEANRLELALDEKVTDSQKTLIQVEQELASGKLKLSAAHLAVVKAALQEQGVTEQSLKQQAAQRDVTKYIAESTTQRQAEADALGVQIALFGKSADARDVEMVAVKSQAWMEAELDKLRQDNLPITDQIRAQLKAEAEARTLVGQATLAQSKALQYAEQLRQENARFGLDYIADERERAAATLKLDNDVWQERIRLAGDGTDAQKLLVEQYNVWYANQAIKPQLDAQKRMWGAIESTAHDTWVSIFNSGKSALDRLRDTLKNGIAELLYQLFARKWILDIGASIGLTGGAAAASAAGSAAGTGLVGLAQTASSLYKLVSNGFEGVGSTIGQGLAYVGDKLGLQAVSNFGRGMQGFGMDGSLGQAAGSGQMAGSALGYGAGLLAGHYVGNAIAGDYSVNHGQAVTNISTIAGALLGGPIGAAIGGAIGGLFNRAFGHGPTEVRSSGIRGTLSDTGVMGGQSYQNLHQNGGWFSSDRNWQDAQDLSATMASGLGQAFAALKLASTGAAEALGVSGSALDGFSKQFDITLTGTATEQQKQIEDFFKGLGDEMALKLVPNLADFQKIGESAAATLERLAGEFQATDTMAQMLGKTAAEVFGDVGIASAAARERLVNLAGGVDALGSLTASYAQNFLTEAERLAPVSKAVTAALADMGLAQLATRDQFKAYIDQLITSGAVLTESGAKQFADLMKISDAFAQTHPDLSNKQRELEIALMRAQGDEAGAVAAERAAELAALDESLRPLQQRVYLLQDEQALSQKRGQLEIDLMRAQGDEAGAVAAERAIELEQMDASLRPLQERIYLLQDEQALSQKRGQLEIALMRAQGDEAAAVAAERARELAEMDASLRPLQERIYLLQDEQAAADAAFATVQRAVAAEKKLRDAAYKDAIDGINTAIDSVKTKLSDLKDLSQALHSTLDGFKPAGQEATQRAAAQAQITAALAIARAGGALPKAADLQKSLSTLSQDSTDLYSSFTDYQRDQYQTAIALSDLADLSDGQITEAQSQLDALEALKDATDAAYNAENERLDGILDTARNQLDALKGIDVSVMSVSSAVERLAALIAMSSSSNAGTSQIVGAYGSALGRAPDAAGLAFWQQQLAAGTPLDSVLGAIRGSTEAQDKLEGLYKSVLGRSGDAAGMDFWSRQLAAGVSMDSIAAEMRKSSEYQSTHKVPGYAGGGETAGGWRVTGEQGWELEHGGPSRVISHSDATAMLDNRVVVEAIDEMRAEHARLLLQITSNTKRTADTNDDMNRRELEAEDA